MEFSHDTVRSIADLARLELTDEEIAQYAGQLSHILDYFQHLEEVDTSHIKPTAMVLPVTNVLRVDEANPALAPEQVVANAADSMDDQFRVSAVLDE